MDTRISDELEAACSEEFSLVGDDLGALEQAVQATMRQLGQGLLRRLVPRQAHGYKGSSLCCECGRSQRCVGYRAKDVHTVLGWVQIRRAYYHYRDCGARRTPYDTDSGLGPGPLSPGLANACCLLAVDDSFDQTSRKIEQLLGPKVSPNTIERLTHQVGAVLVQQADQALTDFQTSRCIPQAQRTPKRLYVAADGTTVHETDGWHESKLGTLYWDDESEQRQRCYVGRFDTSERFGWHLWWEACRHGLREAAEIVYVGDGALWVRGLHAKHFRRATFIVDWYHAQKHIWDCAKILWGEARQETARWGRRCCGSLWDGWTRKVLTDLGRRRKHYRGRKRKALDDFHRYIKVNEEQMRYDQFRAKGYAVGSGMVEGACHHVVGGRLKGSGMIWSRAGSSATSALRICWLNHWWDQLWQQKPLAA